ncbi:DUF4174 domain-containing protein [Paracoccus tegillarcae]|uniref:DUF4174 domain-containing protein n=1 Tax=Paracoccus tegillarcae TaxID=1529068 RepID=A0A2K9EBF2_9RHOB|nr:DUF4174 domain-containing protein [Paracoccus tegillarcae]AUH32220.1 hypothetical protein CUV01_01345 [Paracoccus tegillarcae]
MNLRPVLFVMLVAAMGPGESGGPPEAAADLPPVAQAPVEPVAVEPEAPAEVEFELTVLSAAETEPDQFLWQQRPMVVFADTPQDPAFVEQMQAFERDPTMLIERDVVVITDTDPAAETVWRNTLHPRGFSLVLMDKDGQVKLRKPFPWSVREISRAIDKFPLRRQEIGRAGIAP